MTAKKKICHLTSVHKPNDIRIFHKECVSLVKAGFDVTLIAPGTDDKEVNGVKLRGVSNENDNRVKRMIHRVNEVYQKAIQVDADLYHFHDPELLRIAGALKRKGKRVIYDAHEDVPKQIMGKFWIKKPIRKLVAKTFQIYEERIASKLDYIVTATPGIADRFSKVNSNSIDINNYPLLEEFKSSGSWNVTRHNIGYIGGINAYRGITELLHSMEMVDSKVNVMLAGECSPASFREELQLIKAWSKVNEMGFISRKDVPDLLSKCFAGLVTLLGLPNHIDSQPIKMYEYMAAGIPVIASEFPLWKAIVEEYNCGICVDPESPKEIANAINYLYLNQEEAKEMGSNGRKAVEEVFNWGKEETKLIDIYQRVL